MQEQKDSYLIYTKDIKPRIGFTALDEAKAQPGALLTRMFESIRDTKISSFKRNPETILCQGAALGISESGEVGHFSQGLKFLGFLEGNGEERLAVKVRGSIVLKLIGSAVAKRGDKVYCSGPNTFSLKNIGAEIGRVRFTQDGRCNVFFRREGDEKPHDLSTGLTMQGFSSLDYHFSANTSKEISNAPVERIESFDSAVDNTTEQEISDTKSKVDAQEAALSKIGGLKEQAANLMKRNRSQLGYQ